MYAQNYPTVEDIKSFAQYRKVSRRAVRICKHCGKMHLDNSSMCKRCKRGKSDVIDWMYSYHPTSNGSFQFRKYGEGDFHMGLEMEVSGTITEQMMKRICTLNRREFHVERDSSVSAEFVTHPMTMGYIEENYEKLIVAATTYLTGRGVKAWDAEKVGGHIHLSRSIGKDAIAKIATFFIDKHNQQFLFAVSGRREFKDGFADWSDMPTSLTVYLQGDHPRGIPLNMLPKKTIEFRMFRGSLNPERIWANFRFVYSLVQFVRTDRPLKWEYLFAYIWDNEPRLAEFMWQSKPLVRFLKKCSDTQFKLLDELTTREFETEEFSFVREI